MKRFVLASTILVACIILSGCSKLVPTTYFEHLEAFDETVVEEYIKYVNDDDDLIEFQKRNRLENVKIFRMNLKEYIDENKDD